MSCYLWPILSVLSREKDASIGKKTMWAMKARNDTATELVSAGSVYCVTRPGNLVETATVVSVNDDSFGIPHVRYQVSIGRSDRHVFEEGPRVLALSCFAEHYNLALAS